MDRSFLLQKEVIEASRDFICIRLATYEDKEEVDYLTQVFHGPSGALENTVFTMLAPDARKYLARSGRAPQWAFSDAADMATSMRRFAAEYKPADTQKALPAMKDFRLSLDVAACDNMPLVAAVSDDHDERVKLNQKLAQVAWSRELLGRTAYARAAAAGDTAKTKLALQPGVYVIEPDAFGTGGKILARMDSDADTAALTIGIVGALARFKPPVKEARTHITDGVRKGIYWKTATPVTDPHGPRREEPASGGQ
jgi:hypothetical protein